MEMTWQLFTVVYVMLSVLLAFPPPELWSIGLTVEGIIGGVLGWLGDEHEQFVSFHMRRIAATILCHSALPLGYVACVQWLYPEVLMSGSLVWTLYIIFCVTWLSLTALVVLHWRNGFLRRLTAADAGGRDPPWAWHPLARILQTYAGVLGLPSWTDLAERIDEEYREMDKFYSLLTSWNARTVVTRSFIIRISPYRVDVALQEPWAGGEPAADDVETDGYCRLEVSGTDEHISHTSEMTTAQYLNIQVHNLVPHVDSFKLRINSRELDNFRRFIRVPLHIPAGVIIHRTLAERFSVEFAEQVARNQPVPRSAIRGEMENCIGCYVLPAQVKLTKRCDAAECQNCGCRPLWCVGCMGLWFAHQQDQQHPEGWMAARAPCPSCRSPFCVLDVCAITDN
ncbi:E3 ubiquitin-protein ligase TM129-like [Paramacrobiotus metropolitanus]|uniref:E3 ubiquitin-protein ligase TM129-like n=1 Tax=Paramacrobiotus metropolitanus TaxID=2943436 RepID=UPI002445F051|nr:E3 ubiquitin-protein ligase TM129-like [Paramacrobiotus metropolitanus]